MGHSGLTSQLHFFPLKENLTKKVPIKILRKLHTRVSCWCLDRGTPRWQLCCQCPPLCRPWCCGRSPGKLGKIHEASRALRHWRQTPAKPPAHSLPPAVRVKNKSTNKHRIIWLALDFYVYEHRNTSNTPWDGTYRRRTLCTPNQWRRCPWFVVCVHTGILFS